MKRLLVIIASMIFYVTSIAIAQESDQVAQVTATDTLVVTIITIDGSEIIGVIEADSSDVYTIKTPAGIIINIPKSAVLSMSNFKGKVESGKIFHPDPNKSLYMFAPSAFPIEERKGYCRDFCVFFPSVSYGINSWISVQGGIFWFPGAEFKQLPLVGSIKATVFQKEKTALAGGIMYVGFPEFEDGGNIGAGFTFVTGTYGDRFSHASASLGWGFARYEGDWEFMDRPIVVFAGNLRLKNTIALVTENWLIPGLSFNETPLSLSVRFFGKRIAVDLGAILVFEALKEGVPIPILNFTYHFSS